MTTYRAYARATPYEKSRFPFPLENQACKYCTQQHQTWKRSFGHNALAGWNIWGSVCILSLFPPNFSGINVLEPKLIAPIPVHNSPSLEFSKFSIATRQDQQNEQAQELYVSNQPYEPHHLLQPTNKLQSFKQRLVSDSEVNDQQ